MHVGIIGAGRIGGNCARRIVGAGHDVTLSFSRDLERLVALASELGPKASAGSAAEAADRGDIVILSVPWTLVDEALAQAGSLKGKIVIDTTNQFSAGGLADLGGKTAARYNLERMPGARYTKSFNTLTAAFQAAVAERSGDDRVVQWVCGDDAEAKAAVIALIEQMGYQGVDLGGVDECAVMEAPRRPGAVYGEEYRVLDARAVVDAVRRGVPIPPTPAYPVRGA